MGRKAEGDDDKGTRGVLAFTPVSAPYKCTLLPLDQRINRHDKYTSLTTEFRKELSLLGMSYTIDESGATIGRRYARNDELGIPFAITFDFPSLEDMTVTVRRRDERDQARVPLQDVPKLIRNLCKPSTKATWEEATAKYAPAA